MHSLDLADTWTAELPEGWLAEREGDTVIAVHPDGVGTLHLTELRTKSPLQEEELRRIALGRHGTDPQALEAAEWGEFSGLSLRSLREQNHVWELYLCRGRDLLFLTYVCEQGEEEVEAKAIESILATLRGRPQPD